MIRRSSGTSNLLSSGSKSMNSRLEDRIKRQKRNSQLMNTSANGHNNSLLSDRNANEMKKRIKIEIEEQTNSYDFNVNFYSIPPFGEVQLKEAEEFVQERIKSKLK